MWALHVLHACSVGQHRADSQKTGSPGSRCWPWRRAANTEAPPAWDIDEVPQDDAHWMDSDLDVKSKMINHVSRIFTRIYMAEFWVFEFSVSHFNFINWSYTGTIDAHYVLQQPSTLMARKLQKHSTVPGLRNKQNKTRHEVIRVQQLRQEIIYMLQRRTHLILIG